MFSNPRQQKLIQPVLMGESIVLKKQKNQDVTLVTPSIQTCIAVVVKSEKGIGLAHFDSSFAIKNGLQKMLADLRKMNPQDTPLSAVLIGGEVGLNGSSALYNAIYKVLDHNKISYTHDHYSYRIPALLIGLLTLSYMYMKYTASSNVTLALLLPVVMYNFLYKMKLGGVNIGNALEVLPASFIAYCNHPAIIDPLLLNSFSVAVNVNSGKIEIIKNNPDFDYRIGHMASNEQNVRYARRCQLNPSDPSNTAGLGMYRLSL